MKLLNLKVWGYKNFDDVEINFSKSQGKTLVVGTNGSGKSNLLEILSAIFSAYYHKDKNVTPDFRFELEYSLEQIRTTVQNYKFPLSVKLRNPDGQIMMEVHSIDDDWNIVDNSDFDAFLPEHIVAVYSGEENRLWQDYYFRSYDQYNKQYMNGSTPYRPQKMLYLNKYYWNIIAGILSIHDIEEYGAFLKERIGLNNAQCLCCSFDVEKMKLNKNPMVKQILEVINPENSAQKDIPFSAFNKLKDVCGYESDIFYNIIVLVLYKDFKIITDFTLKSTDDIEIRHLSEGEKKLLLIYGAINIVTGENLYLLDEPDAHLHEGRKKEIFDLIDSTEGSHFIITSHSPTLTNLFEPQKVMMLDCNDKKATVVYGDITKAIHTLTDGQWGYIDHTIFLDKSRPLLLVEGSGDVKYIKHAIKVLSDITPDYKLLSNIDIIHCGGATCIKDTLIEIAPCLPKGKKVIALFDRDEEGGKGIHSIINKGKDRNDTTTYQRDNCYYLKLPKTQGHGRVDFVIEDYFSKQLKKDVAQSFLDSVDGEFNNFTKDLKQSIKDKLSKDMNLYDATVMQGFKVLLDKLLSIINGTETIVQV